jgi:hypothetical protein
MYPKIADGDLVWETDQIALGQGETEFGGQE